jgi:cob(I)alamin adenosyltransferase
MSIATKTGDDGSTALMYGRRLSKNDPRVWAYGTVDELNAALGCARAAVAIPFIAEPVLSIQKELVALMGELALHPDDRERYEKGGYPSIEMPMVDRLTALIDDLEKNHEIRYEAWATPGATAGSAALDLARTTCRRAERYVVALVDAGEPVKPAILAYLNRLSDLCWLWARWVETKALSVEPEA